MATIASHYASTSKIRDVFLTGKVEINNEHKKKIKINNLKAAKNLGVILEKEFKNTNYTDSRPVARNVLAIKCN
jgi:hypothetical protein